MPRSKFVTFTVEIKVTRKGGPACSPESIAEAIAEEWDGAEVEIDDTTLSVDVVHVVAQ
ncbi:hypothetical protein [Kitasatospora sp. NPDC002040]|uniref:hypothetical protein n=1 Tax=Kitasatospora sp. NPDC002040 TaxID=3154661 RepID=UPI00332E32CB